MSDWMRTMGVVLVVGVVKSQDTKSVQLNRSFRSNESTPMIVYRFSDANFSFVSVDHDDEQPTADTVSFSCIPAAHRFSTKSRQQESSLAQLCHNFSSQLNPKPTIHPEKLTKTQEEKAREIEGEREGERERERQQQWLMKVVSTMLRWVVFNH